MPQIQRKPTAKDVEFIPPLSQPSAPAEDTPKLFTIETRFGTVEEIGRAHV
jgi:hypothetical protein